MTPTTPSAKAPSERNRRKLGTFTPRASASITSPGRKPSMEIMSRSGRAVCAGAPAGPSSSAQIAMKRSATSALERPQRSGRINVAPVSPSARGEIDRATRGTRAKRGGENLLDIAPHVGSAETLDRPAVAQPREEVGHAVALIGGQGRGLDACRLLAGDELDPAGTRALSLADRARLVDDERARIAIDGHGEGRLGADLGPRTLENGECALVAEQHHGIVLGG